MISWFRKKAYLVTYLMLDGVTLGFGSFTTESSEPIQVFADHSMELFKNKKMQCHIISIIKISNKDHAKLLTLFEERNKIDNS